MDEEALRRAFVGGRGVRGRIDHRGDADHPAAGQAIHARGGQGLADGAAVVVVAVVAAVVVVVRSATGVGVPLVQALAQPAEAEADGQEQSEVDQRATHVLR